MGVFSKLTSIFGGGNKSGGSSKSSGSSQSNGSSKKSSTSHSKVQSPFDARPNSPTPAMAGAGNGAGTASSSTATATKPAKSLHDSGRRPVGIDLSDSDTLNDTDSFSRDFDSELKPMIGGTMGGMGAADLPPPPPPPAYYANASDNRSSDSRRQHAPAPVVREEEIRTPRNRQELVEELQKSYSEVVTLIRKVDGHLDSQDKRSERLLEIAESIPTALQDLSEIRKQHSQLAEAIDRLSETTRESAARGDTARSQQLEALGEVRSILQSAGEHERRVADSLDEFKSSIGDVAVSTGKLGGVLEGMEARQQRREDDLRQAIESGQKWMATAVVLGLVCLGIVVIVGVLAFAG